MRIGIGFDVHQLVENRKLTIGGVTIPHDLGLLGHSDADVLLHAVSDALLGAAALGDIGKYFPDYDPVYKDADSLMLLSCCVDILKKHGYQPKQIDAVIVAERPKLAPYIDTMRDNIAKMLGIDIGAVGLKATTTEKLGFVGREEGIAAQAVVIIEDVQNVV